MSATEAWVKLRKAWERLQQYRRSVAELAACPPEELRRIACEIGVSEYELRALDSSSRGPAELMPERLRQLGLDPEFLRRDDTAVYRDLERVCARCKASERCARDLAAGDVEAGMRHYCSNAHTIDALIVGSQEPV